MNIKRVEAHEHAKEPAVLEHTTITDAVILSLKEASERRQEDRAAHPRLEAGQAVASSMQSRINDASGAVPL